MGVFIGLDVSLAKTAVCVVDRDGRVLWQGKVPSEPEPLVKRLTEWSGVIDLVGIEACPLSEWLHRGLREAGIPVVCIETRHGPALSVLASGQNRQKRRARHRRNDAPRPLPSRSAAGCPALFAGFFATMAGSDFSRPCIIGFGSSPSDADQSRHAALVSHETS